MKHLAPKGTYLFDFWTDVLYPSVVENETDTTARGYALGGLIFMLFNATEASLAHNLPRDDEIEALRQHCMDLTFPPRKNKVWRTLSPNN